MTKEELMHAVRQIVQGGFVIASEDCTERKVKVGLGVPVPGGDWSMARVTIEDSGSMGAGVWAQTTVNGKHMGNRCGASHEFARLCGEALADALGLENEQAMNFGKNRYEIPEFLHGGSRENDAGHERVTTRYQVWELNEFFSAGAVGADKYAIAEDLTGWTACNGMPGRWFWGPVSVRVSRNRVLIKQSGGFDV